jgi:predicted enzyme related to lactoylglutathione lyase
MARVLGLGGVFFKAQDPKKLGAWYREWLDMPVEPWGAALPYENLPASAYGVWTPFKADTDYFAPSRASFMVNLVVDDVDACLARVKEGGAEVMAKVEESEFGRFGWFVDPEGNKVELWAPPAGPPDA